jgi:ATP-dependent protease ClpP protease subunit
MELSYWGSCENKNKKRRLNKQIKKTNKDADSDDDDDDTSPIKLPFLFHKNPNTYIYTSGFHVYFNTDITNESAFELNKELRNVDTKINVLNASMDIPKVPIHLHLTTNGGLIYAALSIIDCIKTLRNPVHIIVDGFVASAGTLILLAGTRRYMCENAYLLIHELRSGMWGKMTEIEEEYLNLKKLMSHIIDIYTKNTKLKKKELETTILKKDIIWNLDECIHKGIIHEKYINTNA